MVQGKAPAANARQRFVAALQSGDLAAAVTAGRALLRASPDDAPIHHNLGHVLGEIGHLEEAAVHARRAVELAPEHAQFRQGLASLLVRLNQHEEAVEVCEEGLPVVSEPDMLIGYLAELHVFASRFEEARTLLSPRLEHDPPEPLVILAFARLAPRIDAVDRAVELLLQLEQHPAISENYRTRARFRLGMLLDRTGRFDEAFAWFDKANSPAALRYSPQNTSMAFEQLMRRWSESVYRRLPVSGIDSQRPVFIVSVPRSGSTLVEQIIDSHPEAGAMGEWRGIPNASESLRRRYGAPALDPQRLKAPHLAEAARRYLEESNRFSGATRVTDKMLTNFQHIGLISLLFPDARIIECLRHPFDTALSAFFQDFTSGNPWASSLRGMACFRQDFDRVMSHWKRLVPNPILTVHYETLVEHQEAETRRILEFLDLPWNDACMEFHRNRRVVLTASNQQVNQQIYASSMRRYRNYASHLGPLRDVLGDPERLT
ncbi:MAG: sulfotransferase [Phycisphaerales bacterium]|nr:sulfotransferase [Phycisphaerales bacterium]